MQEAVFVDYEHRILDTLSYFWGNSTGDNSTDFDSNLQPVQDVSVDAVVASLYFNAIVFVVLMISYECLRRLFPAVYSSRKKIDRTGNTRHGDAMSVTTNLDPLQEDAISGESLGDSNNGVETSNANTQHHLQSLRDSLFYSLPDDQPLDWVQPVFFGVPWRKVRKTAGLDGYFFLRYIRMNVRITAVATFWFFLTLVPIYATGSKPNQTAHGWYHISAANVHKDSWRMWAPVFGSYIFSAFICFVMKQEYRHFLELRQDFLARGSAHVDPQHHYSLLLENIPYELRSATALQEYFEKLFPGKVHSASIVLNLPELEEASARCMRTCRRLEKSIAYLAATDRRPTHIVGRGRCNVLGVDLQPFDLNCVGDPGNVLFMDDDFREDRVTKGTRVDSISYYTHELASHSQTLLSTQEQMSSITDLGNDAIRADHWLMQMAQFARQAGDQIMDDSEIDNELRAPSNSSDLVGRHDPRLQALQMPSPISQAENMSSHYGSFGSIGGQHENSTWSLHEDKKARLVHEDPLDEDETDQSIFATPFGQDRYGNGFRRMAGRLGLDFVVAGMKFANKQLDVTLEGVLGTTMSSTGFVTFLDLASTTCAASAPLTVKAHALGVSIAPEPREILWENARMSKPTQLRREGFVNFLLFLGVILWSFPLAAIQLFAKAENIAQIPGMGWVTGWHGGKLTSFINGYLPVIGLLGLIMILPVIFEYLAVKYERRKTFSDVQNSMLGRYFYYQLANIYVSVTAGSILLSLKDILDHPSSILLLLGQSLPTMAGYMVALLVTKIMAGLPMVFLRFGALFRMVLLKTLSNEKKLTQREIDAVYRQENVQYGWEFPTQLLVVVIVFTYAVICPVILPVGLAYFVGALIVYKKQVLYVYTPVYESGGAMFPGVIQRSLFGLVCAQLTLLGYAIIRGCYYQPVALLPLPVMTVWIMRYFDETYAKPSDRLSLERAREFDRLSAEKEASEDGDALASTDRGIEKRKEEFDVHQYRQPVLTEFAAEPWTYRRGQDDPETNSVRDRLGRINRHTSHAEEEGYLPSPT